jgi:hypothetical protein
MTEHERDDARRQNEPAEDEPGEPGARGGTGGDEDTLPGAPGESDTPLGDTDQHSDVPSE